MNWKQRKEITDQIMRRLSTNYKEDSVVYRRVRKALSKLSGQELDSLDCMVLTSTGRKGGET